MTEQEWLQATDPLPMLDFLKGRASERKQHWFAVFSFLGKQALPAAAKVSDRKLRLFACACCRQVWHLLTDELSRCAVEVAEHYADGQVTVDKLAAACARAWDTAYGNPAQDAVLAAARIPLGRASPWAALLQAQTVAMDVAWAAAKEPWDTRLYASTPAVRAAAWAPAKDSARAIQAALLRCIVGNPFCPAALDLTLLDWNGGLIRQLAQVAYDERQLPSGHLDPDRLGVLADALEEAGCQDQAILGHLRQPEAVHVRGCHVVDVLLAKE
jgi:hypothetical protein